MFKTVKNRVTEEERLEAVHHVVHDYANLVSSGTMTVAGRYQTTGLVPPVNTHVGHAFLVNCRKMYEFFLYEPSKDDIRAKHFLTPSLALTFDLLNWGTWHNAMNKQLMHITFTRVTKPKQWEGHDENKLFLDEFMKAWKEFRRNLKEPYKSKFDSEIAKKLKLGSEFQGLDLS